eukprot:CAMPEP_0168604406 /NCGR_PEP_ID=MMETSP0420-20121227/15279_1 /TAXON_ID=498008 /ORGANISM="Pessonella sp." /LENGTH=128 /DNA_ID=CAMNT_0008643519 /DNA_START=228 /DNA_END=610 /DNA_ORIENTATION=+
MAWCVINSIKDPFEVGVDCGGECTKPCSPTSVYNLPQRDTFLQFVPSQTQAVAGSTKSTATLLKTGGVSVSNNTWRVPRPDWIGINHGFGSNVQQYTAVFDIRFDLSDTSGDVESPPGHKVFAYFVPR